MRFAPGEEGPDFDPRSAPRVGGVDWPEERLRKVERNYAMEYARTILPELVGLFGPAEGRYLGHTTGRLIGMQFYDELAALLDIPGSEPAHFGELMKRIGEAQGDRTTVARDASGAVRIRQESWRLMEKRLTQSESVFDAGNGLWEGALAEHDRHLLLEVMRRIDRGEDYTEWLVRKRPSRSRSTTV